MDSLYKKARRKCEKYFNSEHDTGLCYVLGPRYYSILKTYALLWPYTPKDNGTVSLYYIPVSKENLDYRAAADKYNKGENIQLDPLRKEFANFVLKGLAEDEGEEFNPIP